jgi:hypothetical protein
MNTVLDVQEVQQLLDKAARDAKHGPSDIRAGRFVQGCPTTTTSAPDGRRTPVCAGVKDGLPADMSVETSSKTEASARAGMSQMSVKRDR